MKKTVLITGGSGRIGRPLVRDLASRRVRLRIVGQSIQSRDFPSKVGYLNLDLSEPAALVPDLDKTDTVFLHPRAVGRYAAALVTLAAEHGVRRLVALSELDVDEDPARQPSRLLRERTRETEQAVLDSGLPWVIVRGSSYVNHTLDLFAAQARAGDVIRGAYPAFAEAPAHERDLQEVLAKVLLDDDIEDRVVEVTGPEALSHRELADVIADVMADVTQRSIRFEEIPPELAVSQLVAGGLPDDFAAALIARCARAAGEPALVTTDVEDLLGRPARSFAQWVTENVGRFQRQPGRR